MFPPGFSILLRVRSRPADVQPELEDDGRRFATIGSDKQCLGPATQHLGETATQCRYNCLLDRDSAAALAVQTSKRGHAITMCHSALAAFIESPS